jgi:plasmid stabilization system protein ParE
MKLRLSKGAKHDFKEGLNWYRERSYQAAAGFIDDTQSTAVRILKHPTMYRPLDDIFRIIHCDTYPYSMIYRIMRSGIISVTTIAHDKRRPGYWRGRKD